MGTQPNLCNLNCTGGLLRRWGVGSIRIRIGVILLCMEALLNPNETGSYKNILK